MRSSLGLTLLMLILLAVSAERLEGQAPPATHAVPPAARWGARPVPPEMALTPGPLSRTVKSDSTRRRPFFLPRPGEQTAYWVGWGTGLALSPLLWCEGTGCRAIDKATTSLLLGMAGAVSGLLLKRTF